MNKLLEKAIKKVKQLPESEQKRIALVLLKEVENQNFKSVSSPFVLENQPFVGMWKDRTEMRNSSEWVRQVRREQL
ncbi:MAG: hypothetical protein N5P05_004126 (plasmid) [Chroococcopsis gigantea SAG 12.99]|jgi:hypothetical protein|nr:hypothetical protein [Chroococcopsis gigantea SAG 12.99]